MNLIKLIFGKSKNKEKQVQTPMEEIQKVENFNSEAFLLELYTKNKVAIELVIDKLKSENIVAKYDSLSITYEENGEKYSIGVENIDFHGNNLAWFQTSSNDKNLLRIFEDGRNFNWQVKDYNFAVFHDFYLLEWVENHLIFIYQGDNRIILCAIKNEEIKRIEFYGDQMFRKESALFLQGFGQFDSVRRITLPELIELEKITIDEAEKENVVPKTLGYEYLLKFK